MINVRLKKHTYFTKAVLTAVLAAALTGVILAGCGSGPAQGDGPDEALETAESADASENGHTAEVSEVSEIPDTSVNVGAAESETVAGTADSSPHESTDDRPETADTAAAVSASTASDLPEAGAAAGMRPEEELQSVPLVYGDERADLYLPLLEGKRVAVFSNQTGIVGNRIEGTEDRSEAGGSVEEAPGGESSAEEAREGESSAEESREAPSGSEKDTPAEEASLEAEGLLLFGQHADGTPVEYGEHILDALVRQGVDVRVAFSPEHGFRGTEDAGAQVGDYIDEKTGVPVVSLYGSGSLYPSAADMDRFDTLVIDIQDVGLRYYTYYISMYYLMDACAAADKEVVILDRPNPNGYYVDGPILQEDFSSGIGILPLPVVHGMTLGELAQMINGEGWLPAGKDACRLTVIPCDNYTHSTQSLLVARPSPNLKDMRAVYLYASTCFFENTACSVGRGTMHPFEIYGSPHMEGAEGYEFTFMPESMEGAHSPPYEGQVCFGKDLRDIPLRRIREEHINLNYVIDAYRTMREQAPEISFFGRPDGSGHYWMDYLCGTDRVRRMIEDGSSAEEIKAWWQADVEAFKEQRRPYLLYAE